MQNYDVVETELFEQTLEDTIDYIWTKYKNEQARYFPINDSLRSLLKELKELQEDLGISSEFIFCNPDGQRIKTQ